MSWRWIYVAAALAALVALFGTLVDRNLSVDTGDEAPALPGYYLKDAVITQTQPDGSPDMRLVAARIEQQPKDAGIRLDTVRVDYFRVPERHWILTAEHGTIPQNSRTVEFHGDVELRPAESKPQAYLHTEALAIDTDRNVAYTTTSPVAIRFGAYTMTVKRLEADLTTDKIKLESARGNSGS